MATLLPIALLLLAPLLTGGAGLDARPRREMHPVVCAECGTETLVPFLPRGDRPVYCSPCFERVRGSSH